MNIKNFYWYFTAALPIKFCDDVIEYGLQKKEQMAVTGLVGNKKLNGFEVNNKNKKNPEIIIC